MTEKYDFPPVLTPEELEAWKRNLDIDHTAERFMNRVPPAQPERCEYCNEDTEGFVTPIEKNGHAFVRFSMNGWELSLKAKGWHGSAKIRYCPMCGRDLLVK